MNKNTLTKTPVVFALAILCCILWGSATPAIKTGYAVFNIASGDTAAQILFAGMRFVLAGILTILFGSLISKKPLLPQKTTIAPIVKLAMVQTILQYVFFYIGHAHTTGVKAAIINGSNVFLAILFAVIIFKHEKMTWLKLLACAAGFAGIVIINLGEGFDMNMSFMGEGAILISASAYALSSGMIKKYSQTENPVVLSGYQFFLGGLVMCAAGFIAGGRVSVFTAQSVTLLIYLAIISSVAYTVWGILLKYNPVGKVAIFGFTNPIFGVILSGIFLTNEKGQAFNLQTLIALALVSVGIFIINKAKE